MEDQKGFDALRFLRDHNIQHSTTHHHCTDGWVQVHCPFCPAGLKKNFHLGIEFNNGRVSCWRCGSHRLPNLIKELLGCPWREAIEKVQEYSQGGILRKKKGQMIRPSTLSFPIGTGSMTEAHLNFLKRRGFVNPERLASEWGLLGTGPHGPYKFRIIIPVYYKGEAVSYTSRDITGRSALKYKSCSQEDEVKPIKDCLYGIDKAAGDSVVVVEGPADAWKFGPGAVATFGIKWTKAQANILAQTFSHVTIFFDPEPQAYQKAKELADYIGWECQADVVTPGKWRVDPGGLSEEEARGVMKELKKGRVC